ncbi:LCP family protein [Staphylococcus argensis]|uniref:LytR family transcriptional regulator n=1 Tax=Staphylococcus argensis TaxID=1607738 RepID=A0A2K4FCV0_9STAP|nr:LCP family protein [Staphylococcus argensis]MCY6992381.1 LCP family protein [Staphylococcus argensis]POA09184.1 LytR family transcriptional regulator [Staphylococcus argensis]
MKKRYKIIILLIIILLIGALITLYFTFKVNRFNNNIHESVDKKEKVKATQQKLKHHKPISIALFGVDSNAKRSKENLGQRTDTLLIASVNPEKEKTYLMSIPRDTYSKISGTNEHEKIAHAYAYGGPKKAINTIEDNFDIPIDSYMTMDMDGFKQVIDSIGGIKVKSLNTFNYNGSSFKKNRVEKMNGKKALDYVRSRKEVGSDGDEGRTKRQRQIIQKVVDEVSKERNISTINKIINAGENNVKTSFTVGDIKTLYFDYKPATNHIGKLKLKGENLVEEDGLWYFEPDDKDKKDKREMYLDNLK